MMEKSALKKKEIKEKEELSKKKADEKKPNIVEEKSGVNESKEAEEKIVVKESTEEEFAQDVKEVKKESFFFQGGKYSADPDSTYSRKTTKGSGLFLLGISVFIMTVIASTGIGFLVLNNMNFEREEEAAPVVVEPTAVPTEIPLDRSAWTFEVLNGSGKSGEAARISEELEELGYVVDSIGNADENIDSTEIYLEEGAEEEFEPVLKELQEKYENWEVAGILEDADDVRVRIILGSE